jgi:2-polyprenyl-6-methoxyphenol hydroxylase-like FAD-dependent oxidoreductase
VEQIARRAVVVGASMGGLLAARVLADHFAQVVVVDRDPLPASPGQRRGVPQGRHAHVLLARGGEVLEQLFPGLAGEVVARGGRSGDLTRVSRIYAEGEQLAAYDSGLPMLISSRPLLESVTRERVRGLPNVRMLAPADVTGLLAQDRQVVGVHVRSSDGERDVPADLVVSATGRARAPLAWLGELGYPLPREDRVDVDITYVSRAFRCRRQDLDSTSFVMVTAEPPARRWAFALAQEDDLWLVSLGGLLGERAPTDLPGFTRYVASLHSRAVADLIASWEPVGDAAVCHFPGSRRLRYEDLSCFPEGFLVVGDGISSFNPVYGQGMTVAAQEAVVLDRELRQGLQGLAPRFFAASSKIVDVPWTLAAGGDLR